MYKLRLRCYAPTAGPTIASFACCRGPVIPALGAYGVHTPIYIFDADGVVINPWGFAKELEMNYGISRETTASFFTGPFQQCLLGRLELRVALSPYLIEWGWNKTIDELIYLWLHAEDQPNKIVLEKIRELRSAGFKCCLASNQETTRATYITKQMRFSELFDNLYFSCNLDAMKPDAAFYSAIESDLEVHSSDIRFIDDSLSHVEAARQAGWKAIQYKSEHDLAKFA